MAGRKHHFIQRHLLGGFVLNPSQRYPHVWVYRHDGKIIFPSIDGFGAERDFYGSADLDEKITNLESEKTTSYISLLRSGQDREVESNDAAMFAVHVFARSKSFRSMMTASLNPIVDSALEQLSSEDFQTRVFLAEIRKSPALMAKAIGSEFSSFEHFARNRVQQKHSDSLEMLNKFRVGLKTTIAEWQNRMLDSRIRCEGGRRDFLSKLRWRRMSVPYPQLILGDSVIFAEMSDQSVKPVHEPSDDLLNVWLPLSSSLLLVGSTGSEPPSIEVDRINNGSAACSYDAFCALDGKMHSHLVKLIRSRCLSLTSPQVEQIVRDSLDELLK